MDGTQREALQHVHRSDQKCGLLNLGILPDVQLKAYLKRKAGKFFRTYGSVAREASDEDEEAAAAAAAAAASAASAEAAVALAAASPNTYR